MFPPTTAPIPAGTQQVPFNCTFRADECDFRWSYPSNISQYMDQNALDTVRTKINEATPTGFDSRKSKQYANILRITINAAAFVPIITLLAWVFTGLEGAFDYDSDTDTDSDSNNSGNSLWWGIYVGLVIELLLCASSIWFSRKKAKMDYKFREVLYANLHTKMDELNRLAEGRITYALTVKTIDHSGRFCLCCLCSTLGWGLLCGAIIMCATWDRPDGLKEGCVQCCGNGKCTTEGSGTITIVVNIQKQVGYTFVPVAVSQTVPFSMPQQGMPQQMPPQTMPVPQGMNYGGGQPQYQGIPQQGVYQQQQQQQMPQQGGLGQPLLVGNQNVPQYTNTVQPQMMPQQQQQQPAQYSVNADPNAKPVTSVVITNEGNQ